MRWGCAAHRICEPAIQAVLARRTPSRLNSNDESGTDQDTPSPGRPWRFRRPIAGTAWLPGDVGTNAKQALERVISEKPALIAQYRRRAQAHALSNYSWERVTDQYEALLN